MHKILLLSLTSLALVGGAASQAGGYTTKAGPVTKTFKATATVSSAAYNDVSPAGESLGDITTFTQNLYKDAAMTQKIATDEVYCVRTIVGKSQVCTGIFHLHRGNITIIGPESITSVHSLAITGGTGKWRGASGEIVLKPISPVTDRMTFHIEL